MMYYAFLNGIDCVSQRLLALINTWRFSTHYTPIQNFLMTSIILSYENEVNTQSATSLFINFGTCSLLK